MGAGFGGLQQPIAQSSAGLLGMVDGLQQVGQQAMVMGAAMTAVGGAIVGGMVLGLQSVVEPARRVEDALAMVGSVVTPLAGTVEDAKARMKTAALDWSTTHTATADEFLQTAYMMISAGLDEAQAIEATRTAMLTATATMGDGADAAALIATVYNNMGDKTADAATEIGRLGDVITKTQQTFQFANLDQLNQGLVYAVPAAKAAKLGFEETAAVIGQLNSAGLAGSMAGTAFASMLGSMVKASDELGFALARNADGTLDFVGSLQNIEAKFGSLSEMSDETAQSLKSAFGDEGFRAISSLIGKSGELSMNLDKVRNSAGAAAEAAKGIESTDTAFWQIMTNRVDAFKVAIADKLQPALSVLKGRFVEVIDQVGKWLEQNPEILDIFAQAVSGLAQSVANFLPYVLDVVKAVGGWVKENPELVKTIVKIVGAVGMALAVLGPVVAAIGAFIAGVAGLAAPILFIVAGVVANIALIGGVIYGLVKAWEWFKGKALAVWAAVSGAVGRAWSGISASLSGIVDGVRGLWNGVTEHLAAAWSETVAAFRQNFFLGLFQLIKNFTPVGWIGQAWAAVLDALPGIWASITASFGAAWEAVKGLLALKWQEVLDAFQVGFIDGFFTLFQNFTPAGWIAQGLAALAQVVTELMTPVVQWVLGQFSAIGAWAIASWNSIVAALPGVWASIQAAVQAGIDALLGVFAYFSPVPIFEQAWQTLLGWFSGLSLAECGTALLQTLATGIQAATGLPVEALKGVVQKLRNMLPFSPAKEGPLADLDKIRLVETIASTVRPAPLTSALEGATAAAVATTQAAARYNPVALPAVGVPAGLAPGIQVPPVAVPDLRPLRVAEPFEPSLGGPGGGRSGGGEDAMIVNFNIAGNATPETIDHFEEWARANAGFLYELYKATERRESRGNLT